MEWLFLVATILVLWLIERQFNELSKNIEALETRVDVLAEDFEKFRKGEKTPPFEEKEFPSNI